MPRGAKGAKAAKAKAEAKRPVARKSRKNEDSALPSLEKRLAEALKVTSEECAPPLPPSACGRFASPIIRKETRMCHRVVRFGVVVACLTLVFGVGLAGADETCNSPYMSQADQGPGGLRLRLGARRRGARRRLRQAGDVDVNPKSKTLRQGDQLGLGRRARRGAPHGLHRRPPLSLGRRPRRTARSTSSTSRPIPAKPKLVQDHRRPARARPAISGRTPTTRCPGACWCRRCPTPRTRAA